MSSYPRITFADFQAGAIDVELTEKATPAANDVLWLQDSADAYANKKVKVSALTGGGGVAVNDANLIIASRFFNPVRIY